MKCSDLKDSLGARSFSLNMPVAGIHENCYCDVRLHFSTHHTEELYEGGECSTKYLCLGSVNAVLL